MQSRKRLAEKIRKTMRKVRSRSLQQAIERLNPVLRGWVAYFRLTEVKGVLEELDGWLRHKLRSPAVAAMEARLSTGYEI